MTPVFAQYYNIILQCELIIVNPAIRRRHGDQNILLANFIVAGFAMDAKIQMQVAGMSLIAAGTKHR